ncbi:hypothetical protein DFJ77DRAFT_307647 [Powellomyces hirtus]|nr:hypothetical protein DFJ77DRAFT_307647 [Powellomyces hirtus]
MWSHSTELRLVAAVAVLLIFIGAAYTKLKLKIATGPGAARGLARKTSKEILNRELEKQYRAPRRPTPPVPVVDTDAIETVEIRAPAPKGPLAVCYSSSCALGKPSECYSPSCPNGKKRIVPSTATVEAPYTLKFPKRERRMSLFSQILAHPSGAFPTSSKIAPTTVDSIFYLEKLPSTASVKNLFSERILPKYHRFSAVPVEAADGSISWVPYENISLDAHILHATVDSESGIIKYVQSLFCRSWVKTQPMWFVHLVRNSAPGGRSAIVIEVHHVLGDGISQVMVLGDIVSDVNGKSLTIDDKKFKRMMQGSRKPKSLMSRVLENAIFAANTGRALVKVLGLPILGGDSQTLMSVPPSLFASSNRVLIPVPPLSLALVKSIKNKLNVTVNDVLFAALGGAIRKYLEYRSDDALLVRGSSLKMRALMPYSFPRPLDDLHNKWTMISAELPVADATPLARIKATKKRMDAIKASPEPLVAIQLQQLAYRLLGHDLSAQTTFDVFARHSIVFTNVPGFTERMYIAGEPVLAVQPCVSNVLNQLSAVSYCDAIHMNFVVDGSVVLQPERLALFLVRELENLRDAAGVEGDAIVGN